MRYGKYSKVHLVYRSYDVRVLFVSTATASVLVCLFEATLKQRVEWRLKKRVRATRSKGILLLLHQQH